MVKITRKQRREAKQATILANKKEIADSIAQQQSETASRLRQNVDLMMKSNGSTGRGVDWRKKEVILRGISKDPLLD